MVYTEAQALALTPIREVVEKLADRDVRDVFLCHAWEDRKGAAKELNDLLVAKGVKTWFSENDIGLGTLMMREIDKGLANSRVGLVLVTPALLKKVANEGAVAEKELTVLLADHLLIPIVHNASFDDVYAVSRMLASRSGMNTKDDSMAAIAARIAETVMLPTAA